MRRQRFRITLRDKQIAGGIGKSSLLECQCPVDEGKFGMSNAFAAGKCFKERWIVASRPYEKEIEEVVGEQMRCEFPVARRLPVTDRLDDLSMFCKPAGCPPVQFRDGRRHRASQFEPKQFTEKVMIPKPRAFAVDGNDEGVDFF